MIALLRGRLVTAALDHVVLDVAGVGYAVRIAPGARTPTVGSEVCLHTHLAVREDALTLYGFTDEAARELFTTLLGVTGVGPKVALAAIGTLGTDGLRRAVLTEDVAAITVVPGIGKKVAQRLVLELRERLGGTAADLPLGAAPSSARAEVAQALGALGYGAAEVSTVLDDVARAGVDVDAGAPEETIRAVLRRLGGR